MRAKRPWKELYPRYVLVLSAILALNWLFTSVLAIGIDSQKDIKCFPQSVYLIVRGTWAPEVGDFVAIQSDNRHEAVHPHGRLLIKRVAGREGDRLTVAGGSATLNGAPLHPLHPQSLVNLAQEAAAFDKDQVAGPDELVLLADSPRSFDSRFWGMAHTTDIVALVIPLF